MTIIEPGMIFGKLTVVSRAGTTQNRKAIWLCRCACGNTKHVVAGNLVNGGSRSCGCVKRERLLKRNKAAATHGRSRTAMHSLWWGIIQRCRYPERKGYHNYGGRGIKVCEFIAAHSENIEKVIGPRPAMTRPRQFSVDRKDNDGHYSCGSCPECLRNGWPMNLRWATQKEQCNNTRRQKPKT